MFMILEEGEVPEEEEWAEKEHVPCSKIETCFSASSIQYTLCEA